MTKLILRIVLILGRFHLSLVILNPVSKRQKFMRTRFLGIFAAFMMATPLMADELKTIELVVKDGFFTPDTIEGPANQKFKLVVKNTGTTAEEFESTELNREKIVAPGKSITVFLGPLPAGTYGFFGEFHPKTAQGKIILK